MISGSPVAAAFATERLRFARYTNADRDDSVRLLTDPEVMRFVGDGVLDRESAEALFEKIAGVYERGAFEIWSVRSLDGGEYLGHAEIKPRAGADDWEIVYILARAAWGRGFGTEIARALVSFGLDRMGLARVSATVDYANAPSIRVLEKAGMRFLCELSDESGPYACYAVDRPGAAAREP